MRSIRFDGDDANSMLMAIPVHKDRWGSIHGVRYGRDGENENPNIVHFKRVYISAQDGEKAYDKLVLS